MELRFLSADGWRPEGVESDTVSLLLNGEVMVDTGWHAVHNLLREKIPIENVRTLLLTHLHQDHFGGFVHLVDKIAVREAVAPCGDLQFADCVYPVFGTQEYYREYHKFFQYLERSGAKLLPSIECVERMFRFGDYMLECLYPLKNSTMRSVVYAMALCDQNLTEESMKWALDIHKQTCNEDSSIWLLKRNEEDLAVLKSIMDKYNMKEISEKKADDYINKSLSSLDIFEDNEYRKGLIALALAMVGRNQ